MRSIVKNSCFERRLVAPVRPAAPTELWCAVGMSGGDPSFIPRTGMTSTPGRHQSTRVGHLQLLRRSRRHKRQTLPCRRK